MARTEFFCRVAGRYVTVAFLTYDGRSPVGIVSCSAFAEPGDLTCGTPCLDRSRDEAWPPSVESRASRGALA